MTSLGDGFRALRRTWGLPLMVLGVNLATAAVLAVPLAGQIERSLAQTESSHRMLYGFDFPWWSHWNDTRSGYEVGFAPDLFGVGFVYKNLDLLLKGYLPLGLFAAAPEGADAPLVDPLVLGLGAAYLLVQVFLSGGVLSALRGAQGGWTARGLLHGAGFYFGRFFRLGLVSLALIALLFTVNGPLTRGAEHLARESVSERAAMAWLLGRHAFVLAALLFIHLLVSYARVITVVEERSSALLSAVSALGFCLRHFWPVVMQMVVVGLAGLAVLAVWHLVDSAWVTTGYKTQIVTLLLAEALMFVRIALRLGLSASQIALYRRLSA